MGDKKRKGRKKSRKFCGNQHSPRPGKKIQDGRHVNNANDNTNVCASERKIRKRPAPEFVSTSNSAYIPINIELLFEYIQQNMRCVECCEFTMKCSLCLEMKQGFHHVFEINCTNCSWKSNLETSKDIPDNSSNAVQGKKTKEINMRMVAFTRSIGRGHSALENFAMYTNCPPPMTSKSYHGIFQKLHKATKTVAEDSMVDAAREVRGDVPSHEIVDCAVSLDGTWQRRGRASHHGIVTAISVETGKCVDAEVLSNICKACKLWSAKDKTSDEYLRWKLKHNCKINHAGSAGAMESVGAVRIFDRSEGSRSLRYTQYLGDGDASSYKKVCESKPYGDIEITKLECVGHVQKRCGTRLRKLKNANKHVKFSDGKGLAGAGRLTDRKIDTLQNYYGFSIRQNKGVPEMQQAVKAVLRHVSSTDSNKMHDLCPRGDDTWCGYVKNPDTYKHKHGLPKEIMAFIQPIFDDLASPELLRKCTHGRTQNNNECLNKLIWDRCSKEYFVEADVIAQATYSAIGHFNDGKSSVLKVFGLLNIEPGQYMYEACMTSDQRRIHNSMVKSSNVVKKRRKRIRAEKKGYIDRVTEQEGDMYTPGGH